MLHTLIYLCASVAVCVGVRVCVFGVPTARECVRVCVCSFMLMANLALPTRRRLPKHICCAHTVFVGVRGDVCAHVCK